jgi:hypothetical protein
LFVAGMGDRAQAVWEVRRVHEHEVCAGDDQACRAADQARRTPLDRRPMSRALAAWTSSAS